ncbi:hypothetical protein J5N97_023042 [Dioscorea zingiberensis]|uniref:KIB1-4 beta-propeller domain-containing protein n=1 Tax=Dioscorea zingiberensis TaxID=325984 RepID=A0A9D5CD61_9LILI|nr:hypothetical protein J5N97_023042 [Dioscorea zingiberensis]
MFISLQSSTVCQRVPSWPTIRLALITGWFSCMALTSKMSSSHVTTVNAPMNIDHLYLVEVDCHLWVALRYKYSGSENFGVKKGAFRFATILMVSPMIVAIEEVTDLEGIAFFFELNQSFWTSAEEHTQLKKNCVYYTNFPLKRFDDVYGHQDFGIYDIAKRRIERVPGCPFEYPFTWASFAWLMPHVHHNIQ